MSAPIPIKHLHHVTRVTSHLAACSAFYRDVLGFAEIPRPDLGFPGVWLENYGLQIHLIENAQAGQTGGEIDPRAEHIAFWVDDTAAVEERLAAHQVPYRVNIQRSTGRKQVFFHDPDGRHLECGRYG